MDAMTVGQKLVELCQQGKNMEAVDTLYAPDIISIEAAGDEKSLSPRRSGDTEIACEQMRPGRAFERPAAVNLAAP